MCLRERRQGGRVLGVQSSCMCGKKMHRHPGSGVDPTARRIAVGELVAEHYTNSIDERGLATDPDSGEVISCRGAGPREPQAVYRGRSAKELGMALCEGEGPHPLSCLDHALYLGRELQKAEVALESGVDYVQD